MVGEPTCLVPGCPVPLSELRGFSLRCRACLPHRTADSVEFPGGEQKRFCQQCNKFHPLTEFQGNKRGCKVKLEKHNQR